jgi:hypothetical protein
MPFELSDADVFAVSLWSENHDKTTQPKEI